MALYILSFFLLLLLLLGYFRVARHFNITDKPNERSSHKFVTIRGGGIIFPIAAILWFFVYGYHSPWMIFSLLLLATVSFMDDMVTLSSKVRIVVHFIAVTLLFWELRLFEFQWYWVVVAYILVTGWINTFNFMDGINGISAFYSLVALLSFGWLNHLLQFVSQQLIILMTISVLVFSFFNVRKRAKTFAGDVGSVSMAFFLAWVMILLMLKTGRPEFLLFFSVYGIDSAVTILIRLIKHENIFEAHRTHLYQYLSNEMKWPHVLVAAIYAIAQASINTLTIVLINSDKMNLQMFVIILALLVVFYLITRYQVAKSLRLKLI